ncbi:hypothetical protein BJ508DRAFT_330913 [Ascobolus immersus RN42]|uniref:Uncharacterized protein n=1 Tax=Ascobolus immersus RN42 TaxID=1160509 RepID=A0A3N4HXF7_ASCIM|nr:hypothetical protein BJ508DRAFT_330913 [Ascobolus immersus RN42]
MSVSPDDWKRVLDTIATQNTWPFPFYDSLALSIQSAVRTIPIFSNWKPSGHDIQFLGALQTLEEALTQTRSLQALLEQYILFFISTYLPFAMRSEAQYDILSLTQNYFAVTETIAGGRRGPVLHNRRIGSILRTNQLRLVEGIPRAAMDVVKKWIEETPSYGSSTDSIKPVLSSLQYLRRIMNFLVDDRFRSERLEVLLLRYLSETEDINRDVLEGLEKAQVEYETDKDKRRRGPLRPLEELPTISDSDNPDDSDYYA